MRISAVQCCKHDSTEAVSGFKLKLKAIDKAHVSQTNFSTNKKFYGGPPTEIETKCIGRSCDTTCGEYKPISASIT